ncbi:hypothetical protein [uncultured Dysosmobacter sp.]|uniref:hypothetical protein n=1 Tax=uncultured Dysosmobacter sp. TaxID=2591384 RepID=UPI0026114C91|nr:hypothetical protein [uncultured Dysosmobacter sp.]
MKNKNLALILSEQRHSYDEEQIDSMIRRAVTDWLTKELSNGSCAASFRRRDFE